MTLMRTLLIGPLDSSEKVYSSPPLGIHRIASFLKKHGYHCDVVDPTIDPIPDTKDYELIGYSVLGYTLDNTIEHINSLPLAEHQRVIIGGMEASFGYQSIAKRCPKIHAIIIGEGEFPTLHLLKQREPVSFPGIMYVDEAGEIFMGTKAVALSQEQFEQITMETEYQNIPYPQYWEKIEKNSSTIDLYETRVLRLYLKNRCSFKCNFCSSVNFYKHCCGKTPPIYGVSPENTYGLLKDLTKYFPDVRSFFFQDDEFFFPKDDVFALCKLIQNDEELKKRKFLCQGRIEAATPDLLTELKNSNFWKLILGVENFSPNILRELSPGKVQFLDNLEPTIRSIVDHELVPFVNIILTSPCALVEDIVLTCEKCLDLAEYGAEIGINLYCNAWSGADMATWDTPKDGLNFLPLDLDTRNLVAEVDLWYRRFLSWKNTTNILLMINSTRRSILFMSMFFCILGYEEKYEKCQNIFAKLSSLQLAREVFAGLQETRFT